MTPAKTDAIATAIITSKTPVNRNIAGLNSNEFMSFCLIIVTKTQATENEIIYVPFCGRRDIAPAIVIISRFLDCGNGYDGHPAARVHGISRTCSRHWRSSYV